MEYKHLIVIVVAWACYVAALDYSPPIPPTINEIEFCDSLTKPIICNLTDKYRTINGVCNNLKRPYLGAANTRLVREGKARYLDGISIYPKSILGTPLQPSRYISLMVFDDKRQSDPKHTVASMQFGQFVAHDLAFSVGSPSVPDDCCTSDGKVTQSTQPNQKCMMIRIYVGDPLHANKTCLNFIRDFTHADAKCVQKPICGPADQINRVTSYLDLSVNYGNNQDQMASVRSFVDGKLKTQTIDGQTFPPNNPNGGCAQAPNEPCFLTGDLRSNLLPSLTMFHILFIREHNRIADALKALNPQWSDETLFQEARRICIAEYQYIVYYEWLPQLLGLNNLIRERIYFQKNGSTYANDYDENIDPSVINEFTAGAFRFFHTQIEGKIDLIAKNHSILQTTRLSDLFLKPAVLTQGSNFQAHCRGMMFQAAQSMDRNYDAEIRSFFVRGNNPVGVDLKAIDIQRDRDHGLPSYNEMRKFAGLKKARVWEDFLDYISPEDVERLKSVYARVHDVDLSVGGALERSLDSSVGHGPTYHYLLMTQFYNTRAGDRYWFEYANSPGAFTPAQLSEIRKSSMARIICDNAGLIFVTQMNVFERPSDINFFNRCVNLPSVNLTLWKA